MDLHRKEDMLVFRNKRSILMYAVVGLAVIGLLSQLFTNPLSLIKNVLIMLGVALAFFAVLYFITQRIQNHSDDMKKYKQADKQSQSKYSRQTNGQERKVIRPNKQQMNSKRNKHTPHLRVIEGNKPKRNSRVNF